MSAFGEDWNASQFWYIPGTASTLARALLASSPKRIAVVSAPSVFAALKQVLHEETHTAGSSKNGAGPDLTLLEYDNRFAVWPEFIHYDYTSPTRLPANLRGAFDAIIVDPPFLSDECQTKAALTVRWLSQNWSQEGLRLIACTGERMGPLVKRLYGPVGVRETNFVVQHASSLSNEFRCFANFEWEEWKFLTDDTNDR
jgi:EEF1A lysine methyltransferase 1